MSGHRRAMAAALAAIAMIASACGSSTSSGSTNAQPKVGGVLTIDNESGGLWTCDFNPYNGSVQGLSAGIFYEPLFYDNLLNDKKTAMLASDYKWSSDSKTLTFTIRSGVKWSDGQDFSADDVVFTFNLLKQFPAIDLQSVWSVLSSVAKSGSDQVVLTFQQASATSFYQVADQVDIVPQHIWSAFKDPSTQVVNQPVGTGPFTLGQCTPQNIAYTRNANYWQKGLPYVQTVNYPAFTDNDPANQYLAAGQAQWGGQYIPNIDSYYIAKDPQHNHYWFPPINNISLWFNTTKAPFDNKSVRQAFAYAIDRASVSQKGESGYEPAGNQTGVLLPTFQTWYDKTDADKYGYTFNTSKAQSMLQSASFPSSKTFNIITIAGYTDWDASLQVIQDNLKAAGVNVKIVDQSSNDYFNNLFTGNFDIAYGDLAAQPGPNPYYELRNTMDSATTAAIGQTASGDYGRYKNPAVDALFDQFSATTDTAKQHDLLNQVQAIMLEDVPIIPATEGVAWYEYSTKSFAGWPTQQDPYAAPAPWNLPDWEVVLTHLYATS